MKKRVVLAITMFIAVALFVMAEYANTFAEKAPDSEYRIQSGFGTGGFGGGFGGNFGKTKAPTATPIPLTEDTNKIDETAKSVFMLEVADDDGNVFATGSGFLFFDEYTLVTNYHVIEGASSIKAYSDDGYEYELELVIAADKDIDIAILQFSEPSTASPLSTNSRIQVRRGERILTIGSPMGIKNTVTIGNITNVTTRKGLTYYQFSAPISSGNSGGLLINDDGNVLGITTSTLTSTENSIQNINFAIPISYVIDLYNNRTSVPLSVSDYFAGVQQDKPILINILPDCTVRFFWTKQHLYEKTNYHISIEELNGLYKNEFDTTDTLFTWDAVPGFTYCFTVNDGLKKYSETFIVNENLNPTKRRITVDDLRLIVETKDYNKISIDTLSKSEIVSALQEHRYETLVFNIGVNTSLTTTGHVFTTVISSPSCGFCKLSGDYRIRSLNGGYFEHDIDIGDLLSRIMVQSNYELGKYTYQLFIDGYLVSQSSFLIQ